MIRLTNILSEHHHMTPNERISKYKDRIQKLKDKISKAKDKNSDTVKLQKNQIKVVTQTMNNFKQAQSIKKQKSEVTEVVNHSKVNQHYDRIIKVIQQSAKQLGDDDLYELHEKLKKFFNKAI